MTSPRLRAWAARLHLEFLLVGLVGAVAFTWPLALHLGTRLPGCDLVGAYSHCWKHWWTWEALVRHQANPAWTPLLNHPVGFNVGFYLASFGDALWSLPVTGLFGPVASFNAVVLLSTATGCWAAALLALRSGVGRGAASVAGLGWALCPHALGFLQGGAIENMANPYFPLLLLALLTLMRHPVVQASRTPPSVRRDARLAAAAALCLLLLGLKVWFSGLVAALAAGLLVTVLGVWRLRERWRGLAWSLLAVAIGAVAVAIAARVLLPGLEEPVSKLDLVMPSRWNTLHASWKRAVPASTLFLDGDLWLNQQVYGVWALVALLGLARPAGRFWMACTLPFLLDLSLPDTWVEILTVQVTNGAPGLVESLKQILVNPDRRLFPMHLCLALSAAHGIAWMQARLARFRLARVVPIGVLALWTAEALTTAPMMLPVRTFPARSPEYAHVVASSEPGAVIDLPLMISPFKEDVPRIKAVRSRYVFDQTLHRRPTMSSVGSRLEYSIDTLPVDEPILWILHQRSLFGADRVPLPSRWSPKRLLEHGFRWMVLHPDAGEEIPYRRLAHDLTLLCGPPRVFDDGAMLFPIPLEVVRPVDRPLDLEAPLPPGTWASVVPPLPSLVESPKPVSSEPTG